MKLCYLLNRSFREGWQRADERGQWTLPGDYLVFLREVAMFAVAGSQGISLLRYPCLHVLLLNLLLSVLPEGPFSLCGPDQPALSRDPSSLPG